MSCKYTPSRGGHAPGHLRDAFLEWVEEGWQDRAVGTVAEVGYVQERRPPPCRRRAGASSSPASRRSSRRSPVPRRLQDTGGIRTGTDALRPPDCVSYAGLLTWGVAFL